MSPTSDDPTPGSGGARIRAKARVSPRLRPEVADAIGGVERSLVDVATWERLQPSPIPEASAADPEPADEPVVEVDDDPELPVAVAEIPLVADDDLPPPPGAPDGEPEVPLGMRFDVEPAVPPTEREGEPLLSQFVDDNTLDSLRVSGPVLAGAAAVAQGTTQSEEEAEEARRRRRNGRVLTWAGVVLLVGVGLTMLLTRDSGDDKSELPAVTQRSTTTRVTLLVNPDLTTTSTVEVTTTTAPAEVTTTTKASSGGGKKSGGATTPTTKTELTTPSAPPTSSTSTTAFRPCTTRKINGVCEPTSDAATTAPPVVTTTTTA